MTSSSPAPLDPGDAERRFAEMLTDAGLPQFASTHLDAATAALELSWDHGLTIHLDLARGEIAPLDEWERSAILGGPVCECEDPIHITVPGSREDPRNQRSVPGVVIHHVPDLHPDDVTILNGIRVTSPSRTLIDLAECVKIGELREAFARARDLGLLDPAELHAARARVEWRPSLAMLDEVIAEFCD